MLSMRILSLKLKFVRSCCNMLEFEEKCNCDNQIINATSELELLKIIALKLSSIDYRLRDVQQNLWVIKHQK